MRRWHKEKKLKPAFRTPGGHRRYDLDLILKITGSEIDHQREKAANSEVRVALYARVSSAKQREDLKRQIDYLKRKIINAGFSEPFVFKDIGSGLNDKRNGFLRLIDFVMTRQIDKLYVTYPDRLSRFGTGVIKRLCLNCGTQIIFAGRKKAQQSYEANLVADVLALMTSFSGKIHRMRRRTKTPSETPKTPSN